MITIFPGELVKIVENPFTFAHPLPGDYFIVENMVALADRWPLYELSVPNDVGDEQTTLYYEWELSKAHR
jgi:hypothetical protein